MFPMRIHLTWLGWIVLSCAGVPELQIILPPPLPHPKCPFFLSSQPYPSSARRLPAWDKGRRGDWPASEYYGHARVAQGAQVPRWVGTEPDKPPLPSATRGKRRAAAGAFGTARLRRLGGGRLDSFARPAPAPAGTRSLSSHPSGPAPLRTLLLNSSRGGKFATRDPPRW